MSMGSQQAGNTTQTTLPPNYMLPYIGTGLKSAANLLQSNTPQYYPGQTLAPFSPVQQQAMGANIGLDQNLMQGSGNPYENAMFNQAAQATQGQLSSEFAGAGRNLEASMPLRSDQLNNLATNFYGQNYQNDVQNAMNAGQNYMGIGGQIQNQAQNQINANMAKYNYYQNLPYQQLGMYQNLLGGFQTGQQTQTPYFTNPMAGALGGGLAGASAGSSFGPWGTAIGGALGAIGGYSGAR